MDINKVEYNGVDGTETLIDLTADTVTPETLVKGATAHDKSGAKIIGTADYAIPSTSATSPVTDSADGMVQGLTIYGKSEVVDGAIKSIGGAGWGVVDLGNLTYTKLEQGTAYAFRALIDNSKTYNAAGNSDIICSKFPFGYATTSQSTLVQRMPDKTFGVLNDAETHFVYFKDTTYTDATAFKSAMSGVLLYYPLADTTGATPILGITSKNGEGQGTAATITTGLPLRSVSDIVRDKLICTANVKQVETVCGKVRLNSALFTTGSARSSRRLPRCCRSRCSPRG